ncbi:MAG: hypothetical protein COU47_03180 [Candidatus Niyogibacteria bacterium CG10_big_fil_rev_8_21_14_0_10_46_36]|uniref:DUF8173 domain-containing protein n=1 Tax=Candidatus Niyogibacteria bacterium CG10_big_fil_rev_8_21_14_0_10_46_36 TaxID=1974726 RepID=A0A2H0TCT6_9BACT|nr:MAG: hypothetical protein COU47_03180 [Candidatus Niyogibacteria bacterium CG10_big_fil_rev_8_21_14_0_10_46_36]
MICVYVKTGIAPVIISYLLYMNKKLLLSGFIAAMIAVPVTLHAADFFPHDRDSKNMQNVFVAGAEAFHNLYVAGGSVTIAQDILGDLFGAGGSVNVAGNTEKDLFAAGGIVNVTRPVGEDARLAGGTVSVDAPIGGDLLLAGGTLILTNSVQVGGDLWAAGGTITFGGNVAGEARIAGGEIFINGTITGPVTIKAERLSFGSQAHVAGPITYRGVNEAVIQSGADVGVIDFEKKEARATGVRDAFKFSLGAFFFAKLLMMIVVALLLIKFFGKKVSGVVASSSEKFWSNLGIGVLGLIATPIISIILMVTVLGAFAGILLLIAFIFFVLIGCTIASLFIGRLIEKLLKMKFDSRLTWKTVLIGIMAGAIIGLIPFVGWIAMFVFYAIGFGAMLRALRGTLEAS